MLERSWWCLALLVLVGCTDRVDDATYSGHLSGVYNIMGPGGPAGQGIVKDLTPAGTQVGMGESEDSSGNPIWVVTMGTCGFYLPVTAPGAAASWVSDASSTSPFAQPNRCSLEFDGLSPPSRVVAVTMMQASLTSTGQLTLSASVRNDDGGGVGTMGLMFVGTRR